MLVIKHGQEKKAIGEIISVLKGFSANADAGHIVKPERDSIVRAMRLALENAGLEPEDIGHINAHGTGTELNDRLESEAIHNIFHNRPFVSATKGATGHTLGAAGALEAVICVHALKGRWIPPTLNSLGRDPACADLNISTKVAGEVKYRAALSNSFAFGGLNAVLVFATI